tara:strand:+ start:24864 stop:25742 length:879 start_codon:yes stop_codon:yes gene_type:complete
MHAYNITAILVIFNKLPSKEDINKIFDSGVNNICLVNNNVEFSEDKFLKLHENIYFLNNENRGGLAGAYNKALDCIHKNITSSSHIVFLDDDSDFTSLQNFIDSKYTQKFLTSNERMVMSPRYVDTATQMLGRCVELKRFYYVVFSPTKKEPVKVSFVINSFSIWPIKVISEIGKFDTKLGIDHVDTDFCMRAKALNIPIYINNEIKFNHTIGNRIYYRFLWLKLQSSGHHSYRKELIIRNTRILMFRYGFKEMSFLLLCIVRIAYEYMSVMFAEKNKIKKIFFMTKGFFTN